MAQPNFEAEILAEIAALRVAMKHVLSYIAENKGTYIGAHGEYLDRIEREGREELERFTPTGLPTMQDVRYAREQAKDRFSKIIGSVPF